MMDVTVITKSADKDDRPELLCLIGLHGCGKSTFAAAQTGYHVWSMGGRPSEDQEFRMMLHREMRKDLKSGTSVIYDDSNLSVRRRRGFLSDLGSVSCRKVAVLFVCPKEVCVERSSGRSSDPAEACTEISAGRKDPAEVCTEISAGRKDPAEVCTERNACLQDTIDQERIDAQMRRFDPPSFLEGWDEIRIIWHEGRFADPWLDGFVLDQSNKHHSLPLDEHMRQCARHAFELGASPEVCFAAAIHDNGKRWTQTFENREGVKDGQAHYFGHDKYGAYQYLVHANSLRNILRPGDEGFDLYISWLIANHMRPYAWEVSPSLEKKDLQAWGERIYKDIKDLHEADTLAH